MKNCSQITTVADAEIAAKYTYSGQNEYFLIIYTKHCILLPGMRNPGKFVFHD